MVTLPVIAPDHVMLMYPLESRNRLASTTEARAWPLVTTTSTSALNVLASGGVTDTWSSQVSVTGAPPVLLAITRYRAPACAGKRSGPALWLVFTTGAEPGF